MFNPARGVPRSPLPCPREISRQPTSRSSAAEGSSHGSESMGPPAGDPVPQSELLTGRRDTLDRLMPEVYDELRAIARRQLSGREGGGTLATTGLVHEAYLKLVDQSRIAWR